MKEPEPEIWFTRLLWRPFPCHWKGFVLFLGIGTAMAAFILILMALERTSVPAWVDLGLFLGFFIFWFAVMRVVERHTG